MSFSDHSFPIYQKYHRCTHCGYIIESRKPYKEIWGRLEKEHQCPRCKKICLFTQEKSQALGPLLPGS